MTMTPPSSSHLLVMEDDAALAHVLKALFAHFGMTCETVPATRAALPWDLSRFSVILLDLNSPQPESQSLIKDIRATYSQPLIVISETLGGEQRTVALEAGADFALQKPFFPGELLAIIRSLVQRRASAASLRPVRQGRRSSSVTRSSAAAAS